TMTTMVAQYPFRDSILPNGKKLWEEGMALYPFIERINRSGIPVYMTTGWYDIFTSDMFYWYDNLAVPKRLTVRPLDHSGIDANGFDLDYGAEAQFITTSLEHRRKKPGRLPNNGRRKSRN
ncbi:MAG: CocE/NonD family hydrolase, partial [Thermodesulfobacteriota bacterium]